MQSVSSRIWTGVAVSISYDDNNYTTSFIRFLLLTSDDLKNKNNPKNKTKILINRF